MEHKFRKVVVIFIDILGSQSRDNFEEWYNVMSIFSKMVEREKALDETHTRVIYKKFMFFLIAHISFMIIKMALKRVEKICMS